MEHYIPYKIKEQEETSTSTESTLQYSTTTALIEDNTGKSAPKERKTETFATTQASPDWLEGFPEQRTETSSVGTTKLYLESTKTNEAPSEKVPENERNDKYFPELPRSGLIKPPHKLPGELKPSEDFYGNILLNILN